MRKSEIRARIELYGSRSKSITLTPMLAMSVGAQKKDYIILIRNKLDNDVV